MYTDSEKAFFKFLPVTMLVAALNVLFYNDYFPAIVVVALELLLLFFLFFKNRMADYLCFYLIFLCLSLEFVDLVVGDELYGFKNFRILGINLGIWTLIPFLLKWLSPLVKANIIIPTNSHLDRFYLLIFTLSTSSLIMGLIMLISNDNNVMEMTGVISSFIAELYNIFLYPLLIIAAFSYIVKKHKDEIFKIESVLIAILCGIVFSMFVSLISGNKGFYSVETLLVSEVYKYLPFLLVITFYKNYKINILILVFGVLGMLLSLKYNATGKLILLYVIIIFIVLINTMKKNIVIGLLLVLCIVLGGGILFNIVNNFAKSNVLFQSKLYQVFGIFSFGKGWLDSMPPSPQARIVEFISILVEYLHKPWYLFFGKGVLGTVKDYMHMLPLGPGGYSNNEVSSGLFYSMHETPNVLFLYNGLLGLYCFFSILIKTIILYKKSLYILIGGYWFLLIYSFSVTMTAFGLVAMLLGLYELDNKNVCNK